jgi:thiamine-phosphate pyrophosphorylase
MRGIARMLDANLNRAAEAARVLEDIARFVADEGAIAGGFKDLRHSLAQVSAALPPGQLPAHRDVEADAGREREGALEGARSGAHAIAVANAARLSQALRAIEECLKTVPSVPGTAWSVEALRYRAYDLCARLEARVSSSRVRQWRVCLLLTESHCAHPWRHVLDAAIEGGADCIQVREKGMPARTLESHCRDVVSRAHAAGVTVIVNDRADVAVACGADGVHVGQQDLAVRDVRKIAGRGLIVGVSTHSMQEAHAAVEEGADYCGVGAMFASGLKPGLEPSGPAYLSAFLGAFPGIPHLAIGGIGPEQARTLAASGCRGVAVSTSVCASQDPASVVRALRDALDRGAPARANPPGSQGGT